MPFFIIFAIEIVILFSLAQTLTNSLSKFIFRITKSKQLTVSLLAILFLPGVIVHELAHLITASVLFVRTGEIEFVPKIVDGGVKLGSVTIAKTDPLRRSIIGVAPILVGMIIIISTLWFLIVLNYFEFLKNWKYLIEILILFEIGNTMFSSKKDMEGVIEFFATIAIILAVLFIIGFRVPQSIVEYLFAEKVVSMVKQLNLLMLVPIVIDILVIAGTKLFIGSYQIRRT